MDATTDPDVDGTGENSTSLRGINKDQESQSETFSISQNNAIDNVSIASSQSEYDNEMMMAVPETSSGKRRRKQQTPQRCTSVIPGLPPASHFDSVTKMKSAAETEFDICHIEPLSSEGREEDIGASSKEVPQIKLQPTTLNRYLQRNKTKSGFHFKRLHRPYFKKCSKGVVRSQPHQCADCGQKFPLRDSLIRHIGLKHTIKIHQCSFCGKQYRLADSLRKHIKRDHSGETHHCVMCDKYFTSKESLKQHWRIHSGEKPYRCHMCNSQFRYRHNYNQHLRTHSGILENCEFCDKQYHRRDSLMKHIKETHRQLVDDGGTDDPQMFTAGVEFTGSNASDCVPLGNSTPGSLKVTDTNGSLANSINRLFHFCRKCSLSFTSRQALLRHMQSRHHKVILVCPICNLQYHLRDSLRKHVKNVHHMKLKDERNTRAELEIRRLFQRPNSCMRVADVEPDSNRGNQQRSSATSTQVSGTAPYPHIAKLKKCPFCDRYYRLRDTLRIHIKSCHMNNDTDSKTETVETTGGNLSVNLLTGESDFFQKEGLPKSVKFTQSEQEHTEEVNSSEEDKSSQVQDPTKDSSDYNSHEMIDSSPPNEGNASEDCEDVSSHSEHNKNSIIQNNQKLLRLNFSCPTCGVKFEDEIELGTHAASHPTCPICQKQYTLRDSLRHHIKRSHPVYHQEMLDRRNNQKEGTKLSSKKGAFAEKERNTQNAQSDQIGTYGCVTCNVSFPSQEELDIHGKIHLSCPYCPKQYNIKDSLRKHIQSSHPTEYWEKRHVKSYKNVNNNKINSRHDASSEMGVGIGQSPSHHQEDGKIEDFQESITDQILSIDKKPQVNHQHHNLSCSTCGVKFEDEDELDIHAASHPTCLICQKQYTLTDSLRHHIKRTHPVYYQEMLDGISNGDKKPHLRTSTFSGTYLSNVAPDHYQEHMGNQQHSINNKDNDLDADNNVSESNSVTDLGELTSTSSCNHEFEDEDLKAKHLSKCAACPYCSKQYCLRDSLRKHIRRTHSIEFEADGLPTRVLLKNSTIGKQPICSACDQAFKTPADLDEHEKSHHKCEYCGQMYALRESLRKHIYRKHADVHNESKGMDSDTRFIWNDANPDVMDDSESYSKSSDFSGEMSFEANQHRVDLSSVAMDKYIYQEQTEATTSGQNLESENADNTNDAADCNMESGGSHGDARLAQFACSNVFPCSACMIVFESQEALDLHIQSHLACHICGKLYTLRDSLRKHIKRSHPDEYNAMLAEKQKRNAMEIEQSQADSPKMWGLEKRSGEKESKEQENGPLKDSDMVMKNLCYVCFIQFDNDELYESHAQTHPACPHCGKMYRLKDSLKKHVQRSHPLEYEEEREIKLKAKMDAVEQSQADFPKMWGLEKRSGEKESKEQENGPLKDSEMVLADFKQLPDGLDVTNSHQEKTEEKEFFPCTACLRVFKTQDLLDEHAETHPECPHCGRRYKLIDSLRKHIKRSHPVEEEERRQRLSQAENMVSPEQQAYLKQGPYELDNIDQENPPEDELFPCTACPEIFETQDLLHNHTQTHPACPHCGKYYKLIDSLRRHIKRSHPAEEEERRQSLSKQDNIILTSPVASTYASKSNSSNVSMDNPDTDPTNPVPDAPVDVLFPCPACSMIFKTKETLRVHASSHLSCPYCGRLYSLRNSMRKHIQRSHPDEYEAEKLNERVNNYSTGFYDKFADNSFTADEKDYPDMSLGTDNKATQESDMMEPVVPNVKTEITD